jgi:hypothetical protein
MLGIDTGAVATTRDYVFAVAQSFNEGHVSKTLGFEPFAPPLHMRRSISGDPPGPDKALCVEWA